MDDKKPDLNLLLALDALLAELNVTRAAKRLHLSQPALSAQLSRLRALFGDELLIPTSRGMLPTAMAAELQAPLRQVLDEMRTLVSGVHGFDPARATNTFTICASDYMQVAILLPFLLEVNRIAPGVRIMLSLLHDSNVVKTQLGRGDVDVAFLQSEGNFGTGLRAMDVLAERYVGIVAKGSLGEDAFSLDRFLRSKHVMVSPRSEGFIGPTDTALAAQGQTRQVVFAFSSFMFMIEAVAQSEWVALAPARLAARYADRIDEFDPPISVDGFRIAMVWHDRTHDHPAKRWLRDQLVDFCAAN